MEVVFAFAIMFQATHNDFLMEIRTTLGTCTLDKAKFEHLVLFARVDFVNSSKIPTVEGMITIFVEECINFVHL